MKKLLKLTLAFLFLFMASQMKAQVRFGPEVGLNIAKMTIKSSGMTITPSTLTSFHVGVDVEFTLTKNLFLQSGVLYSVKGAKISDSEEKGELSPNYIEVPVHVMGMYDIGGPKLMILAGPYFAYGIAGKVKYNGNSRNITYGNNDNSDLKAFDMGIDVGIGVEMSGVQLTGRYGFGLANIWPHTGYTVKNGVFQISLAYMISSKK